MSRSKQAKRQCRGGKSATVRAMGPRTQQLLREAMPDGAGEGAWATLERWATHLQRLTQTDHLAALVRARSPGARWREAREYDERRDHKARDRAIGEGD